MAESVGRTGLLALAQKRLSRTKTKMLQNLGKAERTTDDVFNDNVLRVERQQEVAQHLQKELKSYAHCLREMSLASKSLTTALSEIYEPEWTQEPSFKSQLQLLDLLWSDFLQSVQDSVLVPVNSYLQYFPSLKAKVAKRGRKMVDFDNCRHHWEVLQSTRKKDEAKLHKAQEEMKEAKRVYEDLNSDLRIELPEFNNSRVTFYASLLSNLVRAEQVFHSEVGKLHESLSDICQQLSKDFEQFVYQPKGDLSKSISSISGEIDLTQGASHTGSPLSHPTRVPTNYSNREPSQPVCVRPEVPEVQLYQPKRKAPVAPALGAAPPNVLTNPSGYREIASSVLSGHGRIKFDAGSVPCGHNKVKSDAGSVPRGHNKIKSDAGSVPRGHNKIKSDAGSVPRGHNKIKSDAGSVPRGHNKIKSDAGSVPRGHNKIKSDAGSVPCGHNKIKSDAGSVPCGHKRSSSDITYKYFKRWRNKFLYKTSEKAAAAMRLELQLPKVDPHNQLSAVIGDMTCLFDPVPEICVEDLPVIRRDDNVVSLTKQQDQHEKDGQSCVSQQVGTSASQQEDRAQLNLSQPPLVKACTGQTWEHFTSPKHRSLQLQRSIGNTLTDNTQLYYGKKLSLTCPCCRSQSEPSISSSELCEVKRGKGLAASLMKPTASEPCNPDGVQLDATKVHGGAESYPCLTSHEVNRGSLWRLSFLARGEQEQRLVKDLVSVCADVSCSQQEQHFESDDKKKDLLSVYADVDCSQQEQHFESDDKKKGLLSVCTDADFSPEDKLAVTDNTKQGDTVGLQRKAEVCPQSSSSKELLSECKARRIDGQRHTVAGARQDNRAVDGTSCLRLMAVDTTKYYNMTYVDICSSVEDLSQREKVCEPLEESSGPFQDLGSQCASAETGNMLTPVEKLVTVSATTTATASSPHLTAISSSYVTAANSSHTIAISSPHIVTISSPHIVTISNPHITAISSPHITAVSSPHITAVSSPHIATAGIPHIATVGIPHIVTISSPHIVTISNPHIVTISNPHITDLISPQNATVGNPQIAPVSSLHTIAVSSPLISTTSSPQKATTSNPQKTTTSSPPTMRRPHIAVTTKPNLPASTDSWSTSSEGSATSKPRAAHGSSSSVLAINKLDLCKVHPSVYQGRVSQHKSDTRIPEGLYASKLLFKSDTRIPEGLYASKLLFKSDRHLCQRTGWTGDTSHVCLTQVPDTGTCTLLEPATRSESTVMHKLPDEWENDSMREDYHIVTVITEDLLCRSPDSCSTDAMQALDSDFVSSQPMSTSHKIVSANTTNGNAKENKAADALSDGQDDACKESTVASTKYSLSGECGVGKGKSHSTLLTSRPAQAVLPGSRWSLDCVRYTKNSERTHSRNDTEDESSLSNSTVSLDIEHRQLSEDKSVVKKVTRAKSEINDGTSWNLREFVSMLLPQTVQILASHTKSYINSCVHSKPSSRHLEEIHKIVVECLSSEEYHSLIKKTSEGSSVDIALHHRNPELESENSNLHWQAVGAAQVQANVSLPEKDMILSTDCTPTPPSPELNTVNQSSSFSPTQIPEAIDDTGKCLDPLRGALEEDSDIAVLEKHFQTVLQDIITKGSSQLRKVENFQPMRTELGAITAPKILSSVEEGDKDKSMSLHDTMLNRLQQCVPVIAKSPTRPVSSGHASDEVSLEHVNSWTLSAESLYSRSSNDKLQLEDMNEESFKSCQESLIVKVGQMPQLVGSSATSKVTTNSSNIDSSATATYRVTPQSPNIDSSATSRDTTKSSDIDNFTTSTYRVTPQSPYIDSSATSRDTTKSPNIDSSTMSRDTTKSPNIDSSTTSRDTAKSPNIAHELATFSLQSHLAHRRSAVRALQDDEEGQSSSSKDESDS